MDMHIKLSVPMIAVILTTAFIILKITDILQWSWVWVLSPLWITLAAFIAIFTIAYVAAVAYYLVRGNS